MGFGIAIFLFTTGAILKFAIHVDSRPVDINMIGVIFMIMGVVTLLLQFIPGRSADDEVVPRIEGHRDTSHDGDD